MFSYCKVCEIRKCGQEKVVKNCAYRGLQQFEGGSADSARNKINKIEECVKLLICAKRYAKLIRLLLC